MAWRIWPQRWPNGREYWTVEDRENGRVRIGKSGGTTKYHEKAAAVIEADRLRYKDKEPQP